MSVISNKDAKDKYGITSEHEKMPNGELRFRLKKDDGTAYIRTKRPEKGEWQNSHYHNKVRETYIVQKEWIGYAQLLNDIPQYNIYKKGDVFTTRPDVIHNIYMPANAVIHTVKFN